MTIIFNLRGGAKPSPSLHPGIWGSREALSLRGNLGQGARRGASLSCVCRGRAEGLSPDSTLLSPTVKMACPLSVLPSFPYLLGGRGPRPLPASHTVLSMASSSVCPVPGQEALRRDGVVRVCVGAASIRGREGGEKRCGGSPSAPSSAPSLQAPPHQLRTPSGRLRL